MEFAFVLQNRKKAWERVQTDALKQIFGYSMNIERQKPTNSEFIALLSDNFRVIGMVS